MTAANSTPAANTVPKSDGAGLLDPAWLEGAVAPLHAVAGAAAAAPHNATTTILTVDPTAYAMVHLRYAVIRGARQRVGTLCVLAHASTPNVADVPNTEVGTSGVTFSVTASSGLTLLRAVVDNADTVDASVVIVGDQVALPA